MSNENSGNVLPSDYCCHLFDFAKLAKIYKFRFANSWFDSPMATWRTLTGTLILYCIVCVWCPAIATRLAEVSGLRESKTCPDPYCRGQIYALIGRLTSRSRLLTRPPCHRARKVVAKTTASAARNSRYITVCNTHCVWFS